MTQVQLARLMSRPFKTVNAIINGKKLITADTALDLEKALGIPADLWLNVQQHYLLAEARRKRQEARAG